ncbi:SRPBCC family protein [Streptomyces sp. NPDC014006]|uniref:SRPBCC family protein n=1 Tax=Streptomyces sp. NPDC014006 TaxID=3364870 RepID=UPI0036F739C2
MRFSDGPGVECEIEIAAAPEQVWKVVTDITTSAKYSPELQEVEWLDGASGPAVGARFSGRNRNERIGEWRTVSRITALEEPRTFTWEVVRHSNPDEEALALWAYTLEPVADGTATRLRHGMRIGPGRGPLQDFVEKHPEREEQIIEGRLALLRTGIEATLAGVKAEVGA